MDQVLSFYLDHWNQPILVRKVDKTPTIRLEKSKIDNERAANDVRRYKHTQTYT